MSIARLLGLRTDLTPFKKNEEGPADLFKHLNITFIDWNLLYTFIKSGKVNKRHAESLNQTCNKFGGIPAFDEEYARLNQEPPQFPKDDRQNEYDWKLAVGARDIADFQNNRLYAEYSASTTVLLDGNVACYYKKKKDVDPHVAGE